MEVWESSKAWESSGACVAVGRDLSSGLLSGSVLEILEVLVKVQKYAIRCSRRRVDARHACS
jgi:hypothetical protein